MQDPICEAKHDQLLKLNSSLAKACSQSPLEYRKVALAAVQLGSRPHDVGLNVEQAAQFCCKMMS